MNYYIGQVTVPYGTGRLKMLQNVDNYYFEKGTIRRMGDVFDLGISRLVDFPTDAYYEMNEKFPKDTALLDFIFCTGSQLLVSPRVKTFFEEEKLKNNEYLPVSIINLEGEKIPEPYYIVHQLIPQDCIDLDKSSFERNDINPEIFFWLKKTVLLHDKIDPEVTLFRMKYYPHMAVFREDLIEKIKAAGLKGIKFLDITQYKGHPF
jgi:hypothetical protein